MLNKDIREAKRQAQKSSFHIKKIINKIDKYLLSNNEKLIEVACAFFIMLEYHFEKGDLTPENVNLAMLLRKIKKDE